MSALFSRSTGILLLPHAQSETYTAFDVTDGTQREAVEAQYLSVAVTDWQNLDAENIDAMLEKATAEYWLERAVSHLRFVLLGLEDALLEDVLEEAEESIGSRVLPNRVLDRLLIAPLKDPNWARASAKLTISKGFGAIASIIEDLVDLQPLLNRLANLWLEVTTDEFINNPEIKAHLWNELVDHVGMSSLLKSENRERFRLQWNLLIFEISSPTSRTAVSNIGKQIAHELFVNERQQPATVISSDKHRQRPERVAEQEVPNHQALKKAEKQIEAITNAVSKGHDANAKKYLNDLVRQQTAIPGREVFGVKSLCNIAKRCADIYRLDFEALCLEKALSLLPTDTWTLIQYGDHLKRVGNYDLALEFFLKAKEQLGCSDVAQSSIADVYAQQGERLKAIDIYKEIPQWREKPEIRTAIADNLRKMGGLDQATDEYREILREAREGSGSFAASEARALTGLAEVLKEKGDYGSAGRMYEEVLKRRDFDSQSELVYKLGYCNVLKLNNDFKQAYRVIDEVIHDFPFAMKARFVRASILGLIGKPEDGLSELSSKGSSSWRAWMQPYYRGLLLLKLERYEDAKRNLVDELSSTIAYGEEKITLRMAAALFYLHDGKSSEVERILSDIPQLHESHANYLLIVMKIHLAAQRGDRALADKLKRKLEHGDFFDSQLRKAVIAIDQGHFSLAVEIETEAFLKLAA